MKLFTDDNGRILAVDSTERTDLIEIEVDESAEDFPFKGWSDVKVCCYRVEVTDGHISMMTPYVPTNVIGALENMESKNAEMKAENEMLMECVLEMSALVYA